MTIREGSKIGNHVRIGTLSDIQGHCEIGNYVNMHSNVHIGQKSMIKDYVWIFPYVILTNDPTPPSDELLGVTVESFAIISTGVIVLPGVHIAEDTLIGAGAIVNKDVEEGKVVVGNPGKTICDITKIKNKFTNEQVYPWRYSFDRGMPWEGENYNIWYENCKQASKQASNNSFQKINFKFIDAFNKKNYLKNCA
ncbi:MAG: acyltransferase [Eubacterium sp.]